MVVERFRIQTRVGEVSVRKTGRGAPTFFWHSLFMDSRSFDPVIERVSRHRTCIAVDGPGHGKSGDPGRLYDLDACADAALEILAALDVPQVDWVGNAWGGHVGAALAIRRAPEVKSLAAIASPMQAIESRLKSRVFVELFAVAGARGPARSGLVDGLLSPVSRRERPELEEMVVDAVSRPPRAGMVRAMRSVMLGRPSLVDELHRIRVPTLFATSDHEMWPLWMVERQAARIPNARVHLFSNTRHLPPLEDPDQAVGALEAFWAESKSGNA